MRVIFNSDIYSGMIMFYVSVSHLFTSFIMSLSLRVMDLKLPDSVSPSTEVSLPPAI